MRCFGWLLGAALLAVLLLSACSEKKPAPPDPFFEKWRIMAEQAQGHSPTAEQRKIEEEEVENRSGVLPATKEPAPPPELPRTPVSLKVRDADLVAVLQALARGANVSILIPPDVTGKVSATLENTPWDTAFVGILRANGLSYDYDGGVLRVITPSNLETSINLAKNEKELESHIIQREVLLPDTRVIPVRYANAADIKSDVQRLLGLGGKADAGPVPSAIEVDEHTNSLIVRAIKSDIRSIEQIVEQVDRPQSQIRLKAYIIEANRDTARELGVRWGGIGRWAAADGNNLWLAPSGDNAPVDTTTTYIDANGEVVTIDQGQRIVDPVQGLYTPTGQRGMSGQGFMFGVPASLTGLAAANPAGLALNVLFGQIGESMLEAQLMALETDQKIKILSNPSIMTLDNQTAFTENGTKVPYISYDEAGNADVKFENAVLRLEITPHRVDDVHLKMRVTVKNDEVDPVRNVAGNPYIIKKQTETTLIARDGETVVISGLTKTRKTAADGGMPWLKDIPALGYLFGTKGGQNQMEEVLIFITPRILPEWREGERQHSMEEIEREIILQTPTDAEAAAESTQPSAQEGTAPQEK